MSREPSATIFYGIAIHPDDIDAHQRLREKSENTNYDDGFPSLRYDHPDPEWEPMDATIFQTSSQWADDDDIFCIVPNHSEAVIQCDAGLTELGNKSVFTVGEHWNKAIEKCCIENDIPYETPGWHVVVDYC